MGHQDGFQSPRVAAGYLPVMPARLPILTPPPQYAPPAQILVETPPPSPGNSSSSGRQGFGFVHPAGQGFGAGQHGGHPAGYPGAQGEVGPVQHAGHHQYGQQVGHQNGRHAGHQHQGGHLGGQHDGHLPGQQAGHLAGLQGGAGAWPHQQLNGGNGGWGGPPPAGSWQQGEPPATKRNRRH